MGKYASETCWGAGVWGGGVWRGVWGGRRGCGRGLWGVWGAWRECLRCQGCGYGRRPLTRNRFHPSSNSLHVDGLCRTLHGQQPCGELLAVVCMIETQLAHSLACPRHTNKLAAKCSSNVTEPSCPLTDASHIRRSSSRLPVI